MSLPYFQVVDHMPMLNFIDKILCSFESCFSRKAAFQWFVVIIMGLMLRSDKLGLTSVIRDLALQPDSYLSMLHFFRASSWSLDTVRKRWFQTVKEYAPLYREQGFYVLIGDGVKQSKEGRHIPGVKKLFQESENSAKPDYIHGHMFGGLGILAGNSHTKACIPLTIRLHDGLSAAAAWSGSCVSSSSHVVQMVEDAYLAAKEFGSSLLLLDRYFLSVPALERLAQLNQEGSICMQIVTKAKKNCTAYEKPAPRTAKRGRPAKKGEAVHLGTLFSSCQEQFLETDVVLYGKKQTIRYYCVNLLWGQQLYQELRFVLVEYKGIRSILVSTATELEPLSIIRLYSYRFQIECTFRELKQQIGAFGYHFWTKHLPKLNYYKKKTEAGPMELVTEEHAQKKVLETIRAIEMHTMLSCIAMGILQILTLTVVSEEEISYKNLRYLRTPSKRRISEATLMDYLRKHIFRIMEKSPELCITRIIQEKQDKSEIHWDSLAS